MSETGDKKEVLAKAYREHEQALLKRSFYKISNRDLADDLVQTTFLKTWEYLLRHKQIDSIRGFLFHVLNRLIIDEYRKEKQDSLDSLLETGFQIALDDSEKLFDQIDGKAAMLLIPLLGDKYEKVVSMRFQEEMTIKEIAEATQQSNNTVVVGQGGSISRPLRRRGDSNSRYRFRYTTFPGWPIRPLWHSSAMVLIFFRLYIVYFFHKSFQNISSLGNRSPLQI